jgi:hypothetical protein
LVIERKFGDTIRSRKRSHQRRESAVKALVYDLQRRLVHALPRSLQLSNENP